MRCAFVLLLLAGILIAPIAHGHPAWHGSAWAVTFDAFAPLGILYQRYAQYSFQGTRLEVPEGVDTACERTGAGLLEIQIGLLTQTSSRMTVLSTEIVTLRAELGAFCGLHEQSLRSLSRTLTPTSDELRDAAGEGMFSGIRSLQVGLHRLLETAIDLWGSDPEQYLFSVAFALHTLRLNPGWVSLSPELRSILQGATGAQDAQQPPEFLPTDVRALIDDLIAWVDVPLDADSRKTVERLVEEVYDAVYSLSQEWGEGRRTVGFAFPG